MNGRRAFVLFRAPAAAGRCDFRAACSSLHCPTDTRMLWESLASPTASLELCFRGTSCSQLDEYFYAGSREVGQHCSRQFYENAY